MADEADIANDYIDNEINRALGRIRQSFNGQLGSKICTDCGEKIPLARCKLGFKLCVQCAEQTERKRSLYADY